MIHALMDNLGSSAGLRLVARVGQIEEWLKTHTGLVALVVTGIGLTLRAWLASYTFLNGDEALHYWIAGNTSLAGTYKNALALNPHPPLFFFIIHVLRMLRVSDFALRLPSVLAGSAAAWVTYVWLKYIWGRSAGLIGAALMALSPAMVFLSSEVRAYALLMLLLVSSLYFLERALHQASPALMLLFGLTLMVAVSVHYATIWFLLAVGPYALYRLARQHGPSRLTYAWLSGQAGVLAVTGFFWVAHISKLRGSARETFWKEVMATRYYFHPGRDNVLGFVGARTFDVFRYLFSSPVVGTMALVLFAAGVVCLWRRGKAAPPNRELGWLLVFPLLIACCAGLAAVYPYGSIRHSSHLFVFVMAAIAFLVSELIGQRVWPVVLGSVTLLPVWLAICLPVGAGWSQDLSQQQRAFMFRAVEYIRDETRPGGVVFSGTMAHRLLERYLYQDQGAMNAKPVVPPGFEGFEYPGGYRLFRTAGWELESVGFGDTLFRLVEAAGLRQGESLTVFSVRWGDPRPPLLDELESLGQMYPYSRKFGANLGVLVVPVGAEVKSDSLQRRVQAQAAALRSLATRFGQEATRVEASFWPAYHLNDVLPARLKTLPAMSYTELRRQSRNGNPVEVKLLPALAFWLRGLAERVPRGWEGMDSLRDFGSARHRFKLLAVDRDSLAAVYSVTSSAGHVLDSLATVLSTRYSSSFVTALAPQLCLSGSFRRTAGRLAEQVLSYDSLYEMVETQDELGHYLPALAFWVLHDGEHHPQSMRYMDEGENYISAGYRFELLALDSARTAGVYAIRRATTGCNGDK